MNKEIDFKKEIYELLKYYRKERKRYLRLYVKAKSNNNWTDCIELKCKLRIVHDLVTNLEIRLNEPISPIQL